MDNVVFNLTYREFSAEMLQSLISQSLQCKQILRYDCYKAPLELHSYTWFRSAAGNLLDALVHVRIYQLYHYFEGHLDFITITIINKLGSSSHQKIKIANTQAYFAIVTLTNRAGCPMKGI
jgi:hypothetical protein